MRTRILLLIALITFSSFSYSDSVYVKYGGQVNLDQFDCRNTVSSFVHRICFKQNDNYLVVLLNDTYYHYCGISNELFNQWISSQSKGRFYNAAIKGKYHC